MKQQVGIGLSEVLISLFLVSIIMTTLTQLYLCNKRQYTKAQELLAERFDLLWINDLVSDSVRRAGFTPCLGVEQLTTADSRGSAKPLGALKVDNGAHFMQINRMSEHFTPIRSIQSSTKVLIGASLLINEKRPILIADCAHAEVHNILAIDIVSSGYLITLSKPLKFSYQKSAYLGEWLEEKWFIKNNVEGVPSLHYQLVQPEELSALIHSIRVNEHRIDNNRLVEVHMGLDKDKTHQLSVVVRGA